MRKSVILTAILSGAILSLGLYLSGALKTSVRGSGSVAGISFDGTNLHWNYRHFDSLKVNLDVYYTDGQFPEFSTLNLASPDHFLMDAPEVCSFVDWIVYSGPHERHPDELNILVKGRTYVCRGNT